MTGTGWVFFDSTRDFTNSDVDFSHFADKQHDFPFAEAGGYNFTHHFAQFSDRLNTR